MKVISIQPQFVDFIPKSLSSGVLYISVKYRTAAHKCCCGCGTKIVTPLTPTDWEITEFNGVVSLWPSVGNWNHPCQSHYIIRKNHVLWVGTMTRQEIAYGRAIDEEAKAAYYGSHRAETTQQTSTPPTQDAPKNTMTKSPQPRHWWERLLAWLRS